MYGPLKFLTFFTRQRAATRVAGAHSMTVLGGLILDTKSNPKSNLILVGHSFGGQILERMEEQYVATGLYYWEEGPIPAAADLVVILNPASPATHAKQMIDLLRWHFIDLERRTADGRVWKAPGMVSITSEGDSTTRIAYPAGGFLGLMTNRFRDYGQEWCSPVVNQRHFYTRTAGHTPALHSHRVRVAPLGESQPEFMATDGGFVVAGESVSMEVERRRGAFNDTPYWIMSVPKEVMADHYDTWNPNLISLISGILTATGALEEDASLYFLRSEGGDPILLWPRTTGLPWVVVRSRRVFEAAEGIQDPMLVGCIPEEIDLANVIGHEGDDSTLTIVQCGTDPGDGDRHTTEIVEIGLAPGGFESIVRTELRSEEHFRLASVDRSRQRVILATNTKLFTAEYGGRSVRPEVLAPLSLAGPPAAMVLDPVRQRLLILDGGNGSVIGYDLNGISPAPQLVLSDLGSPSAMAVDPASGDLYIVDPEIRSILRRRWSDSGFQEVEVVARHEDFREPTSLQIAQDQSLWVGDLSASKVFHFGAEGELIQVFE